MVESPTVLILGAGASKPYGYPTARELIFDIRKGLRSGDLGRELKRKGIFDEATELMEELIASNLPSVDLFLARRPGFVEIGKKLLAAALMSYEKPGELTRQPEMRWYEYLWHQIEAPVDEFVRRNKLSVVTFNYDRSLEQFLFTSLVHTHGITTADAKHALEVLPIVHVYGRLQALDFEGDDGRRYGDTKRQYIEASAEGLAVVGESRGVNSQRATELIRGAETICFLGFGYHRENLNAIGFDGNPALQMVAEEVFPGGIYGSAYRLGADDRERAEEFLRPIRLAGPDDNCLNTLRRLPVLRT